MKITNTLMQKTKIIATMGPTFEDEEIIRKLFLAGVNIVRLNISHNDFSEHQNRLALVKKVRKELDLPISILVDTKGPEIRIGEILNDRMPVKINDILQISTEKTPSIGKNGKFWVSYYDMAKTLDINSRVLVDDGKLSLIVKEINVKKHLITLQAENNHYIATNKSINIPGAVLTLPFLSEYDQKYLHWAVKNGVDYVAASFVRDESDLIELRNLLNKFGGKTIKIMAKIEALKALENLNRIILYSDAIMLARGDLGVEIPFYEVPFYEKLIINKCRAWGKPIVIATQMLDSMIDNPRPTRAEVTDIYYAAISGADSTMLSGETAKGFFPVEAVQVMGRINLEAESNFNYLQAFEEAYSYVSSTNSESAYLIAKAALNLDSEYILVFSTQGRIVAALSRFRTKAKIIALLADEQQVTKFGVNYAVYAKYYPKQSDYNDEKKVRKIARDLGINIGKKVIVGNSKNYYTLRI